MKRFSYFVLGFVSFLLLVSIPEEADANTDEDESAGNKNQVYIVYMGGASTSKESTARSDHAQLLNEHIQRKNNSVLHIYNSSFLGHAVRLSPEEATLTAEKPGVVSVFPDSLLQLDTTRSWDFLLNQSSFRTVDQYYSTRPRSYSNLSGSNRYNTIIGIIDSGISPNHPSFNEDKYTTPISQRWKGTCMASPLFKCNRKVIGARFYDDPNRPGLITSPMDIDGHGTHVASIVGGVPVKGASYYGLASGTARGGPEDSRIAVYRVCANNQCPGSLILKAFDDAIADGVDVISASISGQSNGGLLTDPIAIGSFHAMEKGVIVVASIGNNGPYSETVQNYSPWILSVGATTIDRDFEMDIVLGGRNGVVIKGGGINFSNSLKKLPVYRLVDGSSAGYNKRDSFNAWHCNPGSIDPVKVKETIVLCYNNDTTDVNVKIKRLIEQGALGIIIVDDYLRQGTYHIPTPIPIAAVSEINGTQIVSYITSTKNPLATILHTETILNYKPAPVVAMFSSRGPTPGIPNILKPDVTAPGVGILAAWPFDETSKERLLFNLQSGTSVSCPHASSIAAVVKHRHQNWSPSAIKSAMMTTAISTNNYGAPITTFTGTRATPYDIGSGQISVFRPLSSAGLVYETEPADYRQFLCNLGYKTAVIKRHSSTVPDNFACPSDSNPDFISDLNYPSIAVSGMQPHVAKTVNRIVTNVGTSYSNYILAVEAPPGVHVQVVPNILHFTKYVTTQSFRVTFILATSTREDLFGSITWYNNMYKVRSPFVVSNA